MRVAVALAITALSGLSDRDSAPASDQEQAPAKNNFGPRVQAGARQAGRPARHRPPPCLPPMATGRSNANRSRRRQPLRRTPAKQCGMVQTARAKRSQRPSSPSSSSSRRKRTRSSRPCASWRRLGVFLPTGIALEIDGAAVGRVPYARCTRRVVTPWQTASPDMLDKMRKGTAANFIIYQGPGLGMPMKISLNGFSAAFVGSPRSLIE